MMGLLSGSMAPVHWEGKQRGPRQVLRREEPDGGIRPGKRGGLIITTPLTGMGNPERKLVTRAMHLVIGVIDPGIVKITIGMVEIVIGEVKIAIGVVGIVIGGVKVARGRLKVAIGVVKLVTGVVKVAIGVVKVAIGAVKPVAGVEKLAAGKAGEVAGTI